MKGINNKQRNMFIFGLVALLILVIGATYAYFAVNTVNNFGTSTINAQAGNIGSVTLNGTNTSLSMSLTAVDMVQGNSDVTYYASASGKTTTPTTVTLGTASVTPTSDTNTYQCTYTLNVTHTGTNDMYTVFSGASNKSDNQIILTINGVDYDFNDGWMANNEVSGSFKIKGNQTRDITTGLRIINDSEINQNYLAGSDIRISISVKNNSFSCTAVEEYIERIGTDSNTGLPLVKIGNEQFYDITNAIDYSNLVSTNGNIYNYASGKSVLLARYNLYVGVIMNGPSNGDVYEVISPSANGYGLQNSAAKAYVSDEDDWVGVVPYSYNTYWSDKSTNPNTLKPQYGISDQQSNVYDVNYVGEAVSFACFKSNWVCNPLLSDNSLSQNYSIAYFVENYIDILRINATGRLLTYTEALALVNEIGNDFYDGTTYWLGSAKGHGGYAYIVDSDIDIGPYSSYYSIAGVRPVIVINTSEIAS